MEKVLFNQDLLLYLIEFLPGIYHINLHKICSDIRNIVGLIKCAECKSDNIFLPIYSLCSTSVAPTIPRLRCFDCIDKLINDSRYPIHWITTQDYKHWEYLELTRKSPYINCKYCGIKCCNSEFAHYHLVFRCSSYKLKIPYACSSFLRW